MTDENDRRITCFHFAPNAPEQNPQDFRFTSFLRRRQSSKPLNKLDTRFRGHDEFTSLAKALSTTYAMEKSHVRICIGSARGYADND